MIKKAGTSHKRSMAINLLTFFTWMIIALSLIWILVIVAWHIILQFMPEEIYIPKSISFSNKLFLLLFIWFFAVAAIFLIIYKKNKFYKSKITELQYDSNGAYPWVEIINNPQECNNYIVEQNQIQTDAYGAKSAAKLLSYGIQLKNAGIFSGAISVFRLVIELEKSDSLLKQIAEYRLLELLLQTKLFGREIIKTEGDDKYAEN